MRDRSSRKRNAPPLVGLTLLVLLTLGCRSQEGDADIEEIRGDQSAGLFNVLAGVWEGTLEYANFSDDSRSQIPVVVEIIPLEPPESARLRFKFIEPSGDTIRSEETHRLTRGAQTYSIDGKLFRLLDITGFSTRAGGKLSWAGTEEENGQEVQFRQTLSLDAGVLTVRKETRTPLRFRNGLRLRRKS